MDPKLLPDFEKHLKSKINSCLLSVGMLKEFQKKHELTDFQFMKVFSLDDVRTAKILYIQSDSDYITDVMLTTSYVLFDAMPSLIPRDFKLTSDDDLIVDIGSDRPVIGGDVYMIKEVNNLSVDNARECYELSVNTFFQTASEGSACPVKNASVALLTRYYAQHPEQLKKRHVWSFEEIVKIFENTVYGPRELGLLVGKQESSHTRWTSGSVSSMQPVVQLCFSAMVRLFIEGRFDEWVRNVHIESKARKVDDLFLAGHWNIDHTKRIYEQHVQKKSQGAK